MFLSHRKLPLQVARQRASIGSLFLNERQQSDFACSLDSDRDHALLFCRSSRTTSGNNLTAFVCELAKERNVLVVHICDLVNGQKTDLAALEAAVLSTTSPSGRSGWATPSSGRTVSHRSFLSFFDSDLRNLKSQKDCQILYHRRRTKVNGSTDCVLLRTSRSSAPGCTSEAGTLIRCVSSLDPAILRGVH